MRSYLESVIKQFQYYKSLGEKAMSQLTDNELHQELKKNSNSIAIIVKHIGGNMLSRWTNFLHTDGEKSWRNRDEEFEDNLKTRAEILDLWEEGWNCLFLALQPLGRKDLEKIIYIRNEGHTVIEAINRQMMHYAYHIGQMVWIAKLIKGEDWNSLSIPKGESKHYNTDKFELKKGKRHFTDDN